MAKHNRKLSNFMLTPKFQLKLTYYYIATGLLIILFTGTGVAWKMMVIQDIMNNSVVTDFTINK